MNYGFACGLSQCIYSLLIDIYHPMDFSFPLGRSFKSNSYAYFAYKIRKVHYQHVLNLTLNSLKSEFSSPEGLYTKCHTAPVKSSREITLCLTGNDPAKRSQRCCIHWFCWRFRPLFLPPIIEFLSIYDIPKRFPRSVNRSADSIS